MTSLPENLESAIACINSNLKARGIDRYVAQSTGVMEYFVITYAPEKQVAFYVWTANHPFAGYFAKTKTVLPSIKNSQAKEVIRFLEQVGYEVNVLKKFEPLDLENLLPEQRTPA